MAEATVVLHAIDAERLATAQQIADATMQATGSGTGGPVAGAA